MSKFVIPKCALELSHACPAVRHELRLLRPNRSAAPKRPLALPSGTSSRFIGRTEVGP